MRAAAARHRRLLACAFAAAVACSVGTVGAAAHGALGAPYVGETWSVSVDRDAVGTATPAALGRTRAAGIGSVLLDRTRLRAADAKRVEAAAARAGLPVVVAVPNGRCSSLVSGARVLCAFAAPSLAAARRLVAAHPGRIVVVHVSGPAQVVALRGAVAAGALVAVADLRRLQFSPSAWSAAIGAVRDDPGLGLAVGSARVGSANVSQFLGLLQAALKSSAGKPPAKPGKPDEPAKPAKPTGNGNGNNGNGNGNGAGGNDQPGKPDEPVPPVVPPVGPPPAPKADVFVATTGDDANACTQAAPCATFDRAYRVAQPGQVVEIAAGSYPYQQLNLDMTKTAGADVTFRPAAGATVNVATFALGDGLGTPAPSHVLIRDIHAGEMQAFTPAQHITWINLDAGNFYIRGVQHMLVKGGDWGPCVSHDPSCGGNSKIDYPNGEQQNDDIVVDGASFHGYRISQLADHYECMFIAGGANIAIRNSKFWDCEFYDIFTKRFGPITGLRIENNWFDTPWNGQGVRNRWSAFSLASGGGTFDDVLIRFNSFASDTGIDYNADGDGAVYTNVRVVGNLIGQANSCYDSVSFAYNLIGDGFCGATDRQVADFGYINGGHQPDWDWRLRGNSPAIDFVPGASADEQLATDMEGGTRPAGAGYDAGAEEHR